MKNANLERLSEEHTGRDHTARDEGRDYATDAAVSKKESAPIVPGASE